MRAYVYLLLCADGTYYSGYAADPEKRLKVHNSGKGAKYTRSRRPCRLVYTERCESKSSALKRECALKRLTHEEKRALAESWCASGEKARAGAGAGTSTCAAVDVSAPRSGSRQAAAGTACAAYVRENDGEAGHSL